MEFLYGIWDWLKSGDSAGVLTMVTGAIALIVYRLQVVSREREAALLLLNEIRHAESVLSIITTQGFDPQNEIISVLPLCSWDKNSHIFSRYLSIENFKFLGDFFNGCKAAQSELEQWRRYYTIAREEKAKLVQSVLIDLAKDDDPNYDTKKSKFLEKVNKEDFLFSFGKPEVYFSKYISVISKISGTTVLEDLKKISTKKYTVIHF